MPKSRKKRNKRKAIEDANWQYKMAKERKRREIKAKLEEQIEAIKAKQEEWRKAQEQNIQKEKEKSDDQFSIEDNVQAEK